MAAAPLSNLSCRKPGEEWGLIVTDFRPNHPGKSTTFTKYTLVDPSPAQQYSGGGASHQDIRNQIGYIRRQ
jgi:hypothetical protein